VIVHTDWEFTVSGGGGCVDTDGNAVGGLVRGTYGGVRRWRLRCDGGAEAVEGFDDGLCGAAEDWTLSENFLVLLAMGEVRNSCGRLGHLPQAIQGHTLQ